MVTRGAWARMKLLGDVVIMCVCVCVRRAKSGCGVCVCLPVCAGWSDMGGIDFALDGSENLIFFLLLLSAPTAASRTDAAQSNCDKRKGGGGRVKKVVGRKAESPHEDVFSPSSAVER